MIIDGHAHIYAEKSAEKIITSFTQLHHMEPTDSVGAGTAADLLSRMEASRIDYTVLANFAPVKSIDRTNEWTLSVAREHSGLIPLISVYPGIPVEQVKNWFLNGAKGIKMHNGIQNFDPADPGLAEVYRFCEAGRISVTFHCGETSRVHLNEYTDISHFVPVLKRFPGIPFVMTHLAAGNPDTVFRLAEECPNAIFDTSITMTGEKCIYRIHDDFWETDDNVVRAFRQIGCERITFGSDYPFGNPAGDIRRIESLALTDEEKRMILGENSQRLYFNQSDEPGGLTE